MQRSPSSIFTLLTALFVGTAPATAVTLGNVDDFQHGTTQGWRSGVQNPGRSSATWVRATSRIPIDSTGCSSGT